MPEIQDRHRKQLSVMRGFLEGNMDDAECGGDED